MMLPEGAGRAVMPRREESLGNDGWGESVRFFITSSRQGLVEAVRLIP